MLLNWIYNTPVMVVTLCFGAASIVVSAIGVMISHALFGSEQRARHGELTNITVTNVAVLYTVLLAFIAVATWENFVKAQEVVDSEADYANQVFEDAAAFTEPAAGQVRIAITQYLDTVIQQEWPMQRLGVVSQEAHHYLDQIHAALAAYEPANAGQTVLMQELIRDLNRLSGARYARLQAVNGHIPEMVWIVIVVVGALTITYSCVMRGDNILVHILMVSALTLALTLVVCLIVELDYPFRGSISVSADAFEAARESIWAHGAIEGRAGGRGNVSVTGTRRKDFGHDNRMTARAGGPCVTNRTSLVTSQGISFCRMAEDMSVTGNTSAPEYSLSGLSVPAYSAVAGGAWWRIR
jgi:ABC-type multidrug transport system fused ATPase/permease subunit